MYSRLFDPTTPSKFGLLSYDNNAQYNTSADLVRYFPSSTSSSSSAAEAECYQGLLSSQVMSQQYQKSQQLEEGSRGTVIKDAVYRGAVNQPGSSLPLFYDALSQSSYLGLTSSAPPSLSQSFQNSVTSRHRQLGAWSSPLPSQTARYGRPSHGSCVLPVSAAAALVGICPSTSPVDYWRPTTFGDSAVTSTKFRSTTSSDNLRHVDKTSTLRDQSMLSVSYTHLTLPTIYSV